MRTEDDIDGIKEKLEQLAQKAESVLASIEQEQQHTKRTRARLDPYTVNEYRIVRQATRATAYREALAMLN